MNRLLALLSIVTVFHGAVFAAVPLPADEQYVKSLDGTWRFKLEQAKGDYTKGEKPQIPPDYPKEFDPFYKPDYKEADGWHDIKVPGNWEMAGHSPATYNQPDNASGFYRLNFEVPKAWEGQIVKVNFDGVQNGAEIWLNGEPVKVDEPSWDRENYHEGGWTAFQVDLTPKVKFGQKNLLALRVTKNTQSVNLDTGDYHFLGGVHRPVTLFAVPKAHIDDVKVETTLQDGRQAKVLVIAKTNGAKEVRATLKGFDPKSATVDDSGVAKIEIPVSDPKLWSAEFPNLYDLNVEVDGHRVHERVGIREVSIKDGVLLLNGVPIKLAGMCRHDVSPAEGTATTPEIWRKDIELMKAANVNAIRTSHYPYGKGFYDLCDEVGMYVIDELPYCWTPTNDKKMEPAFLQRARETVRRDKNHPCVLIWTVGNENKEGQNLQAVADLVKQLDSTRPRNVSEFDSKKYKVDISDKHYPPPAKMEEYAKRAKETGAPFICVEGPNTWEIRLAADASVWDIWAPVLQRSWAVIEREPTLAGTFVWEWTDRAVADKSPTKLYYYFPETGINLLKIKGIVDGFRNPTARYYHVKMVFSQIKVSENLERSGDTGSFDVDNRYSFTNLSQIKGKWQLLAAGKAIDSGDFTANIGPLSSGKVSVTSAQMSNADSLRVDFGDVVAHQFELAAPKYEAPPLSAELPQGLVFPKFNLITRLTEKDPGMWKKVTRFSAKLVEPKADDKSLEADIVMDNEPSEVVGHVKARYEDNRFVYQMEWTGPKADVQELGWIFTMSKSHDRFSWKRDALWTVYPDTHIGRPSGTARPDSMNVPLSKVTRPDAYDFSSTKYNCRSASLTDESGAGLAVQFGNNERHHCRGGVSDDGYTLTVNKQVSPPSDISANIVPELFMTLKPGDTIEGSFRVGSQKK